MNDGAEQLRALKGLCYYKHSQWKYSSHIDFTWKLVRNITATPIPSTFHKGDHFKDPPVIIMYTQVQNQTE